MAAVQILPTTRSQIDGLLHGDALQRKFHDLFNATDDMQYTLKKTEKKTKKRSKKGKEKKQKREKSPETCEQQLPNIEICSNGSSFNLYATVRQSVLERCMKEASSIYHQASNLMQSESETEDEDEKIKEPLVKIPKIVGLGLSGVFELINETREKYPELCIKALQALLNMLQGHQPESMKSEPTDIIDGLYTLLMKIAANHAGSEQNSENRSGKLTSLACSSLISLSIALGHTGKLIAAISAMLMSPGPLASQDILVPGILTSLQRSVHAVLVGKTHLPDWLTHGIKAKAQIDKFELQDIPKDAGDIETCAITSDGKYLYVLNTLGLFKVGSGYGGTIKGYIYSFRRDFPSNRNVWLSFTGGKLFCRSDNNMTPCLCVVNRNTLEMEMTCGLDGLNNDPSVLFSDGEFIGQITSARDQESFFVRMYDPSASPMTLVEEIPLKLTRKCIDVFGMAAYDPEAERHTICTGFDEDSVSVVSSKEFALIRTSNGKVLYTGKSQALGIKQGGPVQGKWSELPITKSPKIIQISTGREAQHALLLAEDGSVFFVGTPKRGEDGDGGMAKGRRQPKPVKPKKMIRVEAKSIAYVGTNNGSSALVTKEGELFIFGKDVTHCDQSTGQVTDLKDITVSNVALGKAHVVVLTNKGQIYTFGINNKGQCGREYNPGLAKEASTNVNMADEEEEDAEDIMCAPGKHKWKQDQCMICTVCSECTGYGTGCINTDLREHRNPGLPCGCGSGDSGCTECGACRNCAGEQAENDDLDEKGLLEVFAKNKDLIPLDLIIGKKGAKPLEEMGRRYLQRQKKPQKVTKHKDSNEQDIDYTKVVSLPPVEVIVGTGKIQITQISCGLHHTVVLLKNGDVYCFGSNQYGQLGVGDTTTRGSPTKVSFSTAAIQVAAGNHHTVVLLANGQVYTFGNFQKCSLGRQGPEESSVKSKKVPWYSVPNPVPGIGSHYGRRATWIGASGDQTFVRIDESLINAHTLSRSNIFANQATIGLIPKGSDNATGIKCLVIGKNDGNCRSFSGSDQVNLSHQAVCMDPAYDVLWSYCPSKQEVSCYSAIYSEARDMRKIDDSLCNIFGPELAVPARMDCWATRSHCALHMLGCLDTITTAKQLNMLVFEEVKEKQATSKVYAKEDYSSVNRFGSHGGGWGYSGHSIEAVRFMADTDILLGGFGLYGGRGEYLGRIKLFELGPDGGDNETDGELVTETEEIVFECAPREKFAMLFDEPVLLQANHWYVAWSRISGPSSDCGSSGQSVVTAEDQVVFKFKTSKKSNNGTDVNAGQIPQLLYRLPSRDSPSSCRKAENLEPAHLLSCEFSSTVSPDCFDSLLNLLDWSWKTLHEAIIEVEGLKGGNRTAAVADLQRLVYICKACLRLLKIYTNEVYPEGASIKKKTVTETTRLAECVGNTRDLLRKILSEDILPPKLRAFLSNADSPKKKDFPSFQDEILTECHHTFRSCFHAFYPTGNLKWMCLCDLLSHVEPGMENAGRFGRLLAAIMEALCHPTIKLMNIMPLNCGLEMEEILRCQMLTFEDNTNSLARLSEEWKFPLLVSHMTIKMQMEGIGGVHMSFKEVLDKLLTIISLPVIQALNRGPVLYPPVLVANTCALLSTIVSELAASAVGVEMDVSTNSRPLLVTPNRFTRTSQSAYWNTGNGSPDAVTFSVDRPGIVVAGVCVYGGGGQYVYELELLEDQSEPQSQGHDIASSGQRWNSLEFVKGAYSPEDCVNDIAEIRFEKPFSIKEGVRYAIRLKNQGPRTLNGDGGVPKVKCSDGSTFTFSACSLSNNGTNHLRGQIPQILYYSAPQEGESQQQSNKVLAELQARKNAIDITSAICRVATDLLHRSMSLPVNDLGEVVGKSHLFSSLLPMILAYTGPVASQDPRGAVQVLGLIQEILPPVATLCNNISPPSKVIVSNENLLNDPTCSTTSQHLASVESEHPYKPATVTCYRALFPSNVKWMAVEFDSQCGTAQVEDTLQMYIPASCQSGVSVVNVEKLGDNANCKLTHWPVLRRFYGTSDWPKQTVVLPGNEVIFSLETASDYVKDDKASFYGFKCSVMGYEWDSKPEESILQLEKELSYLGGMCTAALMRKDILLPPVTLEEMEEDIEFIEDAAQIVYNTHSQLLGKGFALSQPPTIMQALEGNLPFSWQSNERAFLKDFIQCTAGTSGGRLAKWLQPDSYLDPKKCEIECCKEELKCSWPCVLTVLTKDQYGQVVHVPNLKVEVKAVPLDIKDSFGDELKKMRRNSRLVEGDLTYGGLPPPPIEVAYEVTVKEKKDTFHAISVMRAYENYSFEELRFATPAVPRPSENMLVRTNNNGTFSASWTPGCVGLYNIHVTIDGFEAGSMMEEVGVPGENHRTAMSSCQLPNIITYTMHSQTMVSKVEDIVHFDMQYFSVHNVIVPAQRVDDGGSLSARREPPNSDEHLPAPQHYYSHNAQPNHGEPHKVEVKEAPQGVSPPSQTPRKPHQPNRMRKFVGKYSAGLRIRVNPSLQSEQIGIVSVGGVISFIDEIHNDDGVWVRLSPDSTTDWCHNEYSEAWCLQYNQHLGKTLLVPVEEPRSIVDEMIKETLMRKLPEFMKETQTSKGPGTYKVVKCGSFGHNIRCRPNLKATAIGMVKLGTILVAVEDVVNEDGSWVKLDQETMEQYCRIKEGEAWSLADGKDGITYLKHESECPWGSMETKDPFSFGALPAGATPRAGFDFFSQSPFGSLWPEDTPWGRSTSLPTYAFRFGHAETMPGVPTFGQPLPMPGYMSPSVPAFRAESFKGSLGVSPLVSIPKVSRPTPKTSIPAGGSPTPGSPKSSRKEMHGVQPDWQVLSVKDLVKALGSVAEKRKSKSKHKKSTFCSTSLLEQCNVMFSGIDPRKLVSILGESRANGNNPTPVSSPPGTPKKSLSRSSSPKPADSGSPKRMSPVCGMSSSSSRQSLQRDEFVTPPDSPSASLRFTLQKQPSLDMSSKSPSPCRRTPPTPRKTPPVTPPLARRTSSSAEGAATRTPPATPPLSRKAIGAAATSVVDQILSRTPPSTPPMRRHVFNANGEEDSPGGSPRHLSPVRALSTPSFRHSSPRCEGAVGGVSTDALKPTFNIGAASPKDESIRLSPKASRKDRGRALRSKRERAASPSARDLTPLGRTRSSSLPHTVDSRSQVKEALSPSVAECLRAVFAAFLWHEGIVHDAMACASFLKFHPNLSKDNPHISKTEKKGKTRMRHATDSSKDREKKVDNINLNEPRVRFALESTGSEEGTMKIVTPGKTSPAIKPPLDRNYSEGSPIGLNLSDRDTENDKVTDHLPPTLQHLVSFWDEISTGVVRVVSHDLILPSPSVSVKTKKVEKKEKDKDKRNRKKREIKAVGQGNLYGDVVGKLFGAAAGGNDRETLCELCGGMFSHPVTYHMREMHPGCGRHAGGKGYNSGGHFCGGWAGNCGEGGVGGSSWYLICDRCREKYMKDKQGPLKEKDKVKKSKKKGLMSKQQNNITSLETHIILKNNAMFLLDLASAAGLSLPKHTKRHHSPTKLETLLPSVHEDVWLDLDPFPPVHFQYLSSIGAQSSDSAFAEDIVIEGEERLFIRSESLSIHQRIRPYRPRLPTEPRHSPLARSGSLGHELRPLTQISPLSPKDFVQPDGETKPIARSAGTSPDYDMEQDKKLQRSVSEFTSEESSRQGEFISQLKTIRRRNNSGGVGDGGMSLLKNPSAAMQKLISSIERKSVSGYANGEHALQRPVLSFIIQQHDLDGLQLAMRQALRKASCRVFAMQALNWLIRTVTQPTCIHDLLWFFVSSLVPTKEEEIDEDEDKEKKEKRENEEFPACEHPLADITIAGKAVYPLPETFHALLQTITDVMMHLPLGSSVQQIAVRCWYLKFWPTDHQFLHECHVFSNISMILSKAEEEREESVLENSQNTCSLDCLKDITSSAEIKVSSRQAMVASLTDNTTETFWESGEEDRNKMKTVTLTCNNKAKPRVIYVHIDNSRDLGNKVSSITISAGHAQDELNKIRMIDLETRQIGWIHCTLPEIGYKCVQLEMKGPDQSLRVRQVKLLGEMEGDNIYLHNQKSPITMQKGNCEQETLRVFRLLTSQVFGKLILNKDLSKKDNNGLEDGLDDIGAETDLREHMVGILFARSKLSQLQKQVCSHIVRAIKKEMSKLRDEWEISLNGEITEENRCSDVYCFELLSMVLALSGSKVGRTYVAQQQGLLQDLFSLLHTGSPRVQRQVVSVLRRVLPEVKPQVFASLLNIPVLPPEDFSILSIAGQDQSDDTFDPDRPGILDVFLSCISKALTVQTKVKSSVGGGPKGVTTVTLSQCLASKPATRATGPRWWMRGKMSITQASDIIRLIQDMASGRLSEAWATVTKAAIAETILNVTRLEESLRVPFSCVRTPTLWLSLASLCVLDKDHVERLSSGEWVSSPDGHGQPRPTCDNHDDGITLAMILCSACGNLCADCDKYLHLHRRTKSHQRQVFKEEEEAIKVDLHEGCGRTKLFWVMALADARTLKAMVEFREGKSSSAPVGTNVCRFCGVSINSGQLTFGNVCSDPECQEFGKSACSKTLPCGHFCGGIKNEEPCLPCLHHCRQGDSKSLKQDADDMCMICFTEALSAAPAIQLKCGHVFHLHCSRNVLTRKWVGPRITFGFSLCPICKCNVDHPVLKEILEPVRNLFDDVRRKALMRLEYEGLHKAEAITTPGARFYNDPAGFAMDRYAYYVCYKCKKAYYGGEARCDEAVGAVDDYDPTELVCGGCSDVSRAQMCPKHGTDFLEYKCRYCCSVAVFFCFGTTHFCNSCHEDFRRVTGMAKSELARCPAGPRCTQLDGEECPLHVQHPPTGEEFALGCGVCRNAHTF